jgi:hypothetical protein
MNTVDLNQSRAVDGSAGGSYSPSADILFTGANNIRWDTSRWPKLTARTMKRSQSLRLLGDSLFAAYPTSVFGVTTMDWDYNSSQANSLFFLPKQSFTDTGGSPDIPYTHFLLDRLIDLSTLTAVRVHVKAGVSVAHAGVPAVKPQFKLWRYAPAGTRTQIGSTVTHPSGTQAAYDLAAGVDMNLTGLTEAMDEATNRYRYVLEFLGEAGSNANSDLTITEIVMEFTVTLIGPG